jgi:biotin carboxyl carrier protein
MKTYSFTLGGTHYDVTIEDITDGKASVSVNGTTYEVALDDIPVIPSAAPAPTAKPKESAAPKAAPAAGGPTTPVNSPLPGVIIEVSVKEGQAVKAGQKVAVLEAMKMENEIMAPHDGRVISVNVSAGSSVNSGDVLISYE